MSQRAQEVGVLLIREENSLIALGKREERCCVKGDAWVEKRGDGGKNYVPAAL